MKYFRSYSLAGDTALEQCYGVIFYSQILEITVSQSYKERFALRVHFIDNLGNEKNELVTGWHSRAGVMILMDDLINEIHDREAHNTRNRADTDWYQINYTDPACARLQESK